ncbi:hypothetical protein JTB14_017411 [Gonioctena quinquepunctata]|nr:hypothetical protein JTB14_017411 [Gonioctena quinquepunctata]
MSDSNNEALSIESSFRHDIMKEVLKSKFINPKNKITDEAIELISEIAKVLVIETAARSAKQAKAENRTNVSLEHVETILPQLMLDFP